VFNKGSVVLETVGRVTSMVEEVRVLSTSVGSVMLVVVVTMFKGVIETFVFGTSVWKEGLFSVIIKGMELGFKGIDKFWKMAVVIGIGPVSVIGTGKIVVVKGRIGGISTGVVVMVTFKGSIGIVVF